jgi:hypothetical protein
MSKSYRFATVSFLHAFAVLLCEWSYCVIQEAGSPTPFDDRPGCRKSRWTCGVFLVVGVAVLSAALTCQESDWTTIHWGGVGERAFPTSAQQQVAVTTE